MPDDARPGRALMAPLPTMGLRPQNFAELERLAEWAANSGAFKAYTGKVADAFIAMQMGSEFGLGPIQSLSSIAVINGNAGVYGDALLALCVQSPHYEDHHERWEGEGDARAAICVAKRRNAAKPVERRFSVTDAKRGKLWQDNPKVTRKGREGGTYETDNTSPWYAYPERMLMFRARSWALRDTFPDVLRGIASAEELHDTFTGTTIEGEVVSPTFNPPPSPTQQMQDAPADTGTPPPPQQAPQGGAGAASGAGSNGNGAKWKAGLLTALGAVKTIADLGAMTGGEQFVKWRAKATPAQEVEIAELIAARRAQLTVAPPAPEVSDTEKALLADIAVADALTLDAMLTDAEFNHHMLGLDPAAQSRITDAMQARDRDLKGGVA